MVDGIGLATLPLEFQINVNAKRNNTHIIYIYIYMYSQPWLNDTPSFRSSFDNSWKNIHSPPPPGYVSHSPLEPSFDPRYVKVLTHKIEG